jgi:hypothetical protein
MQRGAVESDADLVVGWGNLYAPELLSLNHPETLALTLVDEDDRPGELLFPG